MSEDQQPGTPLARLLVEFANTYDVEGDELIGTPDALRSWLAERHLIAPEAALTAKDLDLARQLREGLREAMIAHHEDDSAEIPELADASAKIPVQVAFSGPQPYLIPTGTAGQRALGELLIAVQQCSAEGTWTRLKLCADSTCAWAFYDASKNQCRNWCSMRTCGNRHKTRAYRSRQLAAESA